MAQEIQPLRLAIGSHVAGSGKGCAMNVISWENGDSTITDFPECTDPFLAKLVQMLNDSYCSHRDSDLLCASCSIKVLALGHRTVGTALDWNPRKRMNLYLQFAKEYVAGMARDARSSYYEAMQDLSNTQNFAANGMFSSVSHGAASLAVMSGNGSSETFYQIVDDTITKFIERTGVEVSPVAEEVVACAVTKMTQFR